MTGRILCADRQVMRGTARAADHRMTTQEHPNPWKWPMLVTVYGAIALGVIMVMAVLLMGRR